MSRQIHEALEELHNAVKELLRQDWRTVAMPYELGAAIRAVEQAHGVVEELKNDKAWEGYERAMGRAAPPITEKQPYLVCRVAPGGFSAERVFEISRSSVGCWQDLYTGVCDVAHFLNEPPEEPREPRAGYVRCKVLRAEEQKTMVELPDGYVTTVATSQIQWR